MLLASWDLLLGASRRSRTHGRHRRTPDGAAREGWNVDSLQSAHDRNPKRCPRRAARGLAIGLALMSLPAAASAQTARDGQWLGVGLGGGLDQVACDACAGTPKSGLTGYVRFGGTLSERLLLGAEVDLWTRGDDGIRQYLGALNAIALLYAGPEARFHIKLGVGIVSFRAAEDGDALTAFTFGASGGIGHDFRINDTLSLTPFASLMLAPFADLEFNGELASGGATLGLLQAGLGLTWH